MRVQQAVPLSYRTLAGPGAPGRSPRVQPPSPDRRHRVLLSCVLVLALLLRAVPAFGTSLWLDELHTYHHAIAPSFRALLGSLLKDNHPPLSFALVRVLEPSLGVSEWRLRLPSLLAGVLGVLAAWRLARHLPKGRARIVAPLLVAASSLHAVASSEARMYAWLALFVALWLDAALSWLNLGRGAWRLALITWLGLHTHYHFIHALIVLGPTLLVLAPRERLRSLALPGLAFILTALPWFAWGFPTQLGHDLPPGGSAASLRLLAEGLVHLIFHNASLAGAAKPAFQVAGALALLGAMGGAVALVRESGELRRTGVLLGVAAFALPTWAAIVATFLPRAGFHFTYLTASVVPFALLLATQADAARWRRIGLRLVVAFAVLLACLNAMAPSREDYRGAADFVIEAAQEGDVVIAADWQPQVFPHGVGWLFYQAQHLQRRPAAGQPVSTSVAKTVSVEAGFVISRPEEVAEATRVFLIGRSLKPDLALFADLHARFAEKRVERFGESVFVHVFER